MPKPATLEPRGQNYGAAIELAVPEGSIVRCDNAWVSVLCGVVLVRWMTKRET